VDTLSLSEYLEVLAMGTITAKQLKQKTGEVIKRIKSGERLTLTYRGKPLAVIEPTTSKDINELNKICDSAKAWDRIESTLNSTNPEFKNWREATKWVRKRN
jgi:prevent-host-death family protein